VWWGSLKGNHRGLLLHLDSPKLTSSYKEWRILYKKYLLIQEWRARKYYGDYYLLHVHFTADKQKVYSKNDQDSRWAKSTPLRKPVSSKSNRIISYLVIKLSGFDKGGNSIYKTMSHSCKGNTKPLPDLTTKWHMYLPHLRRSFALS